LEREAAEDDRNRSEFQDDYDRKKGGKSRHHAPSPAKKK
jgi:hypothetical protein